MINNFKWRMFLVLFFFAQLIVSCANQNETSNRMGTNEYSFEVGQEKSFLLDSMTTQSTVYMQLIDDDCKLAIFNKPMHTICIFDIDSGLEVKKVQLYEEGPNNVKGVQGFYYQSDDSIWVYRYWEKELCLLNSNGEIKHKRLLNDKLNSTIQSQYSVDPFPVTDLPIMKDGNTLILQGMNGPGVKDGLQPACTVLYDIVLDQLCVANRYPAIYGADEDIMDNWDTFSYRAVPYVLNAKHEMVVGFPADDSISIYNIKTKDQKRFFAGYSQMPNIKPIQGHGADVLQKHYLEQHQYAGVFYDKYRDLYYRLVVLPIFDYDVNDESTQNKPLAVVILDSSFNKVGEFNLGIGRYMYRNAFVSKDGLHINVYSEDDDYLKFVTLKAVKNEK